LKILILLGTAKIGGAELQGLALGKLLKEMGYKPDIACLSTKGGFDKNFLELVKSYKIKSQLIKFDSKNQFYYVLNLIKVARWISKNYDFCFGFTSVPGIITALCSRKVGRIWLQRDVLKKRNLYFFDYLISLRSDFVLANSELASKFFRRQTAYLKKVKIIGNLKDIRLKKYSSIKSPNMFQCISVSNFKKSKNMKALIDIWIKFSQDPEVDVKQIKLILIGNFYEAYYDEKCKKELELKHNIVIINDCSDPFEYYNSSNFYLTTTGSESRSNSIDHAMYFGLPVIGFRHASISEQVTGDNEKILADKGNIDQYSEILKDSYINPKNFLTIGHENNSKIQEYYLNSYSQWKLFIESTL